MDIYSWFETGLLMQHGYTSSCDFHTLCFAGENQTSKTYVFCILYPHSQRGGYIAITLSIHLSVHPSVHTFVTDISASTGRNDCTSTSCLPCDLQMNKWGYFSTTQHATSCFLNLTSCSEHFISIKHRIFATFNINKKKSILTACMPLIGF